SSAPSAAASELRLHVAGMDCADEAALIRHALAKPGIAALNFDLVGRRVDVTFNPATISEAAILEAVANTGLAAHPHHAGEVVGDDHHAHDHHHDAAKWWAVASGGIFVIGWIIDGWHSDSWTEAVFGGHGDHLGHSHHPYAAAAYGVAAFTGLWPMIPRAITSLRLGRLDMHVLVCLSAVGAAAIGQWAEAATVAFLFAIAHLMEAWSIERARHAVSTLVGHEPGWGDDSGHESAPVERWTERFAAVYTPVVTFAAIAVVIVPPLIDGQWGVWFYRGLIFLVLACPCALVISTPVTVVAALTSAARRGVLFKGGAPLERVATAKSPTLQAVQEAGVNVQCRTSPQTLERIDVVLTCDHDEDIAFLVSHSKRAMRVIRQNVTLALTTKLAVLVAAVLGGAPLWLAVVADTGATVAVTLNGLRMLRFKTRE
ncbi:MAG TPA: cation transporter, partial [Vicinamibacterales bacterium]|nr:cation transporter [Vicinamibacterales bacterium]